MPILTTTPKAIDHPEIPFDRLGVSLAISPIWKPDDVEAAVSITAIPYRVLPDGSIDKLEKAAWSYNNGQVFADAAHDPVLADAVSTMMVAIQAFLAAKGA